ADEIVIELVVEGRVDRVRRGRPEQRVAVRRRAHDPLGADIAAGTRPVLDDERLAEPLREPLPHEAREDVADAAGREEYDEMPRPGRIGLRGREARGDRQRGGARGEMQKSTAWKLHFGPREKRRYGQGKRPPRRAGIDHLTRHPGEAVRACRRGDRSEFLAALRGTVRSFAIVVKKITQTKRSFQPSYPAVGDCDAARPR